MTCFLLSFHWSPYPEQSLCFRGCFSWPLHGLSIFFFDVLAPYPFLLQRVSQHQFKLPKLCHWQKGSRGKGGYHTEDLALCSRLKWSVFIVFIHCLAGEAQLPPGSWLSEESRPPVSLSPIYPSLQSQIKSQVHLAVNDSNNVFISILKSSCLAFLHSFTFLRTNTGFSLYMLQGTQRYYQQSNHHAAHKLSGWPQLCPLYCWAALLFIFSWHLSDSPTAAATNSSTLFKPKPYPFSPPGSEKATLFITEGTVLRSWDGLYLFHPQSFSNPISIYTLLSRLSPSEGNAYQVSWRQIVGPHCSKYLFFSHYPLFLSFITQACVSLVSPKSISWLNGMVISICKIPLRRKAKYN